MNFIKDRMDTVSLLFNRALKVAILIIFIVCSLFPLFSQENNAWKKEISATGKLIQEYDKSNPSLCLIFAGKSLEIAKKHAGMLDIAYEYMGDAHFANSNFRRAIGYFDSALRQSDTNKISSQNARLLLKLGRSQTILFMAGDAIENLYRAYFEFKADHNISGEIEVLIAIGEYYRKTEHYPEATAYLKRAENLMSAGFSDTSLQIKLLGRQAAVLNETGFHSMSITYSNRALELVKKIKDLHLQATSLNELGYSYEFSGKKGALDYYVKASDIWKNLHYDVYYANALVNMARVYFNQKRYALSLNTTDTLEKVIRDRGWLIFERDMYYRRMLIFDELNDFQNAYYNMSLHNEKVVEIIRRDNDERIDEIRTKYESKEKELLIEKQKVQLAAEKKVVGEIQNRKKWITTGAVVVSVLSVLLALLTFRIQQKNQELEQSNKLLEKTIEQKEYLVREIHHRVKNNLSILSGLLHLQLEQTRGKEAKKLLENFKYRVSTIEDVHQHLIDVAEQPRINIGEFFNNYIFNMVHLISKKEIKVNKHISCPQVELDLKTAVPLALIVNEILVNSIKHAYSKKDDFEVGYDVGCSNGLLRLGIYDNGKGFDGDLHLKNPVGFGFKLIRILTEQLEAKITYLNRSDSRFTITLNVKQDVKV